MAFDPSQPFEVLDEPKSGGGFDPSKPFEVEPESGDYWLSSRTLPKIGVSTTEGGPQLRQPKGMTEAETASLEQSVSKPLLPAPKAKPVWESPPDTADVLMAQASGLRPFLGTEGAAQALRSGYNAVSGLWDFATSPLGLETLGLSRVRALAPVVKAAFSADIIGGLWKQYPQIKEQWPKMPMPQKVDAVIQFGSAGVLSAALLKSLKSDFTTKPTPAPSIEAPPVIESETPNASAIPSSEEIPQREVRPPVGEAPPLRQQGQAAVPPVEAAAEEAPPAPAPLNPGGAPSQLSPELRAVSDQNNSREAFARAQAEADALKAAEASAEPKGPGEPPVRVDTSALAVPEVASRETVIPSPAFVSREPEEIKLASGIKVQNEPDIAAADKKAATGETVLEGSGTMRVPRAQMALKPDLMQFKKISDVATGEGETKIEPPWDERAAGKLLLWEPTDPSKYGLAKGEKYIVANGHHRVGAGDRMKVGSYDAQVLREADGYGVEDARRIAAEINIKDGKGTIYDQVRFLRNIERPRDANEEVGARERLGALGRPAADIAFNAGDDLYDLFVNEKVSPEQSRAIANAAPKNTAAQAIGIKFALAGAKPDEVRARMELEKAKVAAPVQTDMFGNPIFDESNNQRNTDSLVAIRRDLRQRIQSIRGAANRPDMARKEGLPVNEPEALQRRLVELQNDLASWEGEWWLNPELRAKLAEYGKPAAKPEAKSKEAGAEQPQTVQIRPPLDEATAADARARFQSDVNHWLGTLAAGQRKQQRMVAESMVGFLVHQAHVKDWGEVTVGDLNAWGNQFFTAGKARGTVATYKNYAEKFFANVRKNYKLDESNPKLSDAQAFINRAPGSKEERVAVAREEAERERHNLQNRLAGGDVIKLFQVALQSGDWKDLRAAAYIAVGLGTGRRGGEPAEIRVSDLNRKDRTIGQYRSHKAAGGEFVSDYAPEFVWDAIDRWMAARKLMPNSDSEYLFNAPGSKAKNSQADGDVLKRDLNSLANRAGVKLVNGEDLNLTFVRHTLATELASLAKGRGEDIGVVTAALGHMAPGVAPVTLRYVDLEHVDAGKVRALDAMLDQLPYNQWLLELKKSGNYKPAPVDPKPIKDLERWRKEPKKPRRSPPMSRSDERLPQGEGMTRGELIDAVRQEKTFGFGVRTVTPEEAAAVARREGWSDAEDIDSSLGFFHQGVLYIIPENIRRGDVRTARQAIREEAGHGLLRTAEGVRLVRDIFINAKRYLSGAEMDALREQGYGLSEEQKSRRVESLMREDPALEHAEAVKQVDAEEYLDFLDEFIAKSSREQRGWWKQTWDSIRAFLAKHGLVNLSNEEAARLVLREAESFYEGNDLGPVLIRQNFAPSRSLDAQINRLRAIQETGGKLTVAQERQLRDLESRRGQQDLLPVAEGAGTSGRAKDLRAQADQMDKLASNEMSRSFSSKYRNDEYYRNAREYERQAGELRREADALEREAGGGLDLNPPEQQPERPESGQMGLFGDFPPARAKTPPTEELLARGRRRMGKMFGLRMGQEYDVQPTKPITDFLRQRYFNSEQPFTPQERDHALQLAMWLTGPKRGVIASEIQTALGGEFGESAQAGVGLLVNELADYGIKGAANGDMLLSNYIRDNWSNISRLSATAPGGSEAGRALQSIQMAKAYRFYQMLADLATGGGEAARKGLGIGEEAWTRLNAQLTVLGVDPKHAGDLLNAKTATGQTIAEMMAEARPEEKDARILLRKAAEALGYDADALMAALNLVRDIPGNWKAKVDNVFEGKADEIMARLRGVTIGREDAGAYGKLANWRAIFTQKGTESLASLFFKILAPPKDKPGPNVSLFEQVVHAELRSLLRQAMVDAGYESASNPKLSTADKIVRFLGEDPLRGDKLKVIDERVRNEIEERKQQAQEELDAAEEDKDVAKAEAKLAKAEELELLWNDVIGTMSDAPGSRLMAQRIVAETLRSLKPDWNKVLEGGATNQLRQHVLTEIGAKLESAMTPEPRAGEPRPDIKPFLGLAGVMFDDIVRVRENRRAIARAERERRGTPQATNQRVAEVELNRYESDQTEWLKPDGLRNQVRELIRRYLNPPPNSGISNEEMPYRSDLATQFAGVGVRNVTAEALAREVWLRREALRSARIMRERELAAKRLIGQAQSDASRILDRMQLTDFPGGKEQRSAVADIVAEYLNRDPETGKLRGPQSDELIYNELVPKLMNAGVAEGGNGVHPDVARELAWEVVRERNSRWMKARLQSQQRAAESGNLRTLVERINESPYLAQKDPQWLNRAAVDWFLSNGLERDQAEAAAKAFVPQFQSRMADAAEKVATSLLERSVDPRNINEIVRFVRAGLFDPNRKWFADLAAKYGWKPMDERTAKQLAVLELKFSAQELSPAERADVARQMEGIVWKHEPSAGQLSMFGGKFDVWMRRINEGFIHSTLSGVRTFTVQGTPGIAALRDFATASLADPKNTLNFAALLHQAARSVILPEMKFAWKKDAYGKHLEAIDRAHNELKRWFEELQDKYETAGPLEKATIRLRQAYALQAYVSRVLSTIDQSMMVATGHFKLGLYASHALKIAGLKTSQIGDLVELMARKRRDEVEQAIDLGLDRDAAEVRANERMDGVVHDFVVERTTPAVGEQRAHDLARQVLQAKERDIYSLVGRRAQGLDERAEGFLSRFLGINIALEKLSQMRGEGGPPALLAVAVTGFVNVPYRTVRFFSSYSPYGFLRYGIYRFQQAHGLDNWFKQSFANETMARQRLIEAFAGTVAFAAFSSWAALHHTSDEEAGKEGFSLYVTGSGPNAKILRDAWDKSGWKPYSLNFIVDGHKVVVPLTRVGEAIMFPFMLSAAIDDAMWKRREMVAAGRTPPTPVNATAATAIGTALYMMGQKGILQSATTMARAAQGDAGAPKAAARLAIGTAAGAALPFKQLLNSLSDMFVGRLDESSVTAIVANQFPIVGLLPGLVGDKYAIQHRAVNRLGDELGDRSWFGVIQRTGVPIAFQVAQTKTNETLYPLLVEKGAAAPELRRYILEEKYGPMTDDQFSDFARISGNTLKQNLLTRQAELTAATSDQAKKIMANAAQWADRTAAAAIGLEPVKPSSAGAMPASVTAGPARATAGPSLPASSSGGGGAILPSVAPRLTSLRLGLGQRSRGIRLATPRVRSFAGKVRLSRATRPRGRVAGLYRRPSQRRLRLA